MHEGERCPVPSEPPSTCSAGAPTGAAPRLLLRVRLTVAAPDALAMSPSGTRLAVAGDEKDGCWFVETDDSTDGGARVVGRVAFPINFGRAVAACWTCEDQLLVAGPNATVAVVRPPAKGAVGDPADAWAVKSGAEVRSAKVELPLVAVAGAGGSGKFAAIAADRSVRACVRPPGVRHDGHAQAAVDRGVRGG